MRRDREPMTEGAPVPSCLIVTTTQVRGRRMMWLSHPGRVAVEAADLVAPSCVPLPGRAGGGGPDGPGLRALELREIEAMVQAFRQAALEAVAAGMDGVELDAASGHLAMQFLSTNTNLREDRYGGSSVGRCQFVLEVMQAMGEAIGHDRLGIRIHPGGRCHGMEDAVPAATYSTLLRELSGQGYAYVHLIRREDRSLDALMMTRGYWSGDIVVSDADQRDVAVGEMGPPQAQGVQMGHYPV